MRMLAARAFPAWESLTSRRAPRDIERSVNWCVSRSSTVMQTLTGFENHGGGTVLGPDASPLGRVVAGVGNGVPQGQEAPELRHDGVVQGSVIATYMHGPALARNPELADLLLERATGATLEPLEVPGVAQLRAQRLAAIAAT